MLNYFLKNPKVQQEYGDGSILVNLNQIITNMDQILAPNPLIILKSLKLINSMAFKNSMDVRRQMKCLNMFELRDELIILHLKNISQILLYNQYQMFDEMDTQLVEIADITKCILRSLCDFSYDVVASKAIFRTNMGVEIFALALLQTINRPNLLNQQM